MCSGSGCRAGQMIRMPVGGISVLGTFLLVGGLTEDEMVALPGDMDLRDGMAVQIVNTDAAYLRGKG